MGNQSIMGFLVEKTRARGAAVGLEQRGGIKEIRPRTDRRVMDSHDPFVLGISCDTFAFNQHECL